MNEVAGIFVGIGALMVMGVFAYLLYQLVRLYRQIADKYEYQDSFYIASLCKLASKSGIDLDKEVKKRALVKDDKNFNKLMESKIIEEAFENKNGKSKN